MMIPASMLQLELSSFDGAVQPSFAALDGTFSGATNEPFQRWYPYLEGYSSDFVRKILTRFAPAARSVLDPFGGTGTTAFVAGEMGLDSFVCEVNPVMQFMFEAKISVRRSGVQERAELVESLRHMLDTFPLLMKDAQPDPELLEAYKACFGKSQFFGAATLIQVARARSALDELMTSDPVAARLITVAILASLIPSSFLKRAGDLRYKTPKELAGGIPPFGSLVANVIRTIITDIAGFRESLYLRRRPTFACADARTLVHIPPLGIDSVITSPPYINGTNYFRNARLELWFLRCLRHSDDLSRLRHLAVTAGINDVTQSREPGPSHPDVEKVVRRLADGAYDDRIPRMVAAYFADLGTIFEGISGHLAKGALAAVDIGDSNYAGVHVPAHRLLCAVVAELGYTLESEVLLRRRRSKNGAPLSQVLLVLRAPGSSPPQRFRKAVPAWTKRWKAFQEELPHQQLPYSSRNWGSEIHSLCSYPGKLKPAIAHQLISIFVPPAGRILDPFAGVGTIPFEAALNGRLAFGFELSPAAFPIAAAKLTLPSASDARRVVAQLGDFLQRYTPTEKQLEEAAHFGLNGKITDFYNADTLNEVLGARQFFASMPPVPAVWLAKAACLHILHGNRPYALSRRSHPLTPYKPTGPSEYRPLIPRLTEKIERTLSSALPAGFQPGRIFHQDSTGWWPAEVNALDAVITSPPFFDSTRFHVQNWLRLWFAGWAPAAFQTKHKLFVDERQKLNFTVYESILRQSRDRLNVGGVVVLHLGKSAKCDMAKELRRLGKRWFPHSEVFDESVAHCESHGIRDKGTVTAHQYLILY